MNKTYQTHRQYRVGVCKMRADNETIHAQTLLYTTDQISGQIQVISNPSTIQVKPTYTS